MVLCGVWVDMPCIYLYLSMKCRILPKTNLLHTPVTLFVPSPVCSYKQWLDEELEDMGTETFVESETQRMLKHVTLRSKVRERITYEREHV